MANRILKALIVLALIFALPACTVKNGEKLGNATGFGGTNDVMLAMLVAKSQLTVTLQARLNNNAPENFGNLNFRGDSTAVKSLLVALESSDDKKAYLATYLTPARVTKMISDLQASTFNVTLDPTVVTRNGHVEDALTSGTTITFFESAYVNKKPDDFLKDLTHEVLHLQGTRDEDACGAYTCREIFSTTGAGFVAYRHFLKGETADAAVDGLLFSDTFNRADAASPGSAWEIIAGQPLLRNHFLAPPLNVDTSLAPRSFQVYNVSVSLVVQICCPW